MSSTTPPKAAKDLGYTGSELQGQYRLPNGQQCMQFNQIASDGGLLPMVIKRDSFELWPAKRREFDPSRLTAQELAVARLVAEGMSNRQVASELFISIKTVQFHLTHIYAKLGVSSRAELAAHFRDTERPDNHR